jgi:hypothetical protein
MRNVNVTVFQANQPVDVQEHKNGVMMSANVNVRNQSLLEVVESNNGVHCLVTVNVQQRKIAIFHKYGMLKLVIVSA